MPVVPPVGDYVHPISGPFKITPENRKQILFNFTPIPMDYEHASAQPAVAKGGPVPASGQVLTLEPEDDADGWRYGISEPTPTAARMVESKEYFAVSPEINWKAADVHGTAIGPKIECVAFTNRPFFETARLSAVQLGENSMEPLNCRFDESTGRLMVMLPDGSEAPLALPDNVRVSPAGTDASA